MLPRAVRLCTATARDAVAIGALPSCRGDEHAALADPLSRLAPEARLAGD